MKHLFTKAKAALLVCAALFTANMAFAETGTETEQTATGGGAKDTQVDGQSYYVAGGYIAGTGSAQTGDMTSKGFKLRTGTDGKRVVFSVNSNYTIKSLSLTGASNYELTEGGSLDVKVTKVEVDGVEVGFTGGDAFKYRGEGESCTLTVDDIAATESIAIYFDNGDSKGSQINATWAISWERADATQPTITVTPTAVALIPGATYQLTSKVDPADTFTTLWVSDNEAVATVSESGLVTAVAPGTANVSLQWADDATVATTAVVNVADFDINAYNAVKTFDFTTMGDVTLTIESEAAGAIWNEANNKPNNVFFCTNEGLEDIAVQAVLASNKGWSIVDGKGLYEGSGAGRCAAIGHLTAGQVVEIVYTGTLFATGSNVDAVRKDDGAAKTALNLGVGRAIYKMDEDGLLGFELTKGNYVEKIVVYEEAAAEPSEAYIQFDKSRLANWDFPKYVITGTEIAIPYIVDSYMGSLSDVTVSLLVNGEVADTQTLNVEFDEEMQEGSALGLFTYTAAQEGELTIQLQMSYQGSEFNEGWNETDEVVITVSDSAPEAPVLENIAALKAYDAQGTESVVLTLNDAKVTFADTKLMWEFDWNTWEEVEVEKDYVVIEDATAGIMLEGSGLGKFVTEGQTLNGQLALSVESVWGDIIATLTESGIEGVEATDGEVTPMEITDDNLFDYIASPEWRLVALQNVTFKVESGDYGDDIILVSDVLGEVGIMDVLGTGVVVPEDATKADVAVGYFYTLYGGLMSAFQPVSFTHLVTTGMESMKAATAADAPVYTLSGVRVAAPQKGIYIQNGKKVVVK